MKIPIRARIHVAAGICLIAGLWSGPFAHCAGGASPQKVTASRVDAASTEGKLVYRFAKDLDSGELIFNPKTGDLRFLVRHGGKDLSTAEAVSAIDKMKLLRPLLEQVFKESGKADQYRLAVAHYSEVSERVWNAVVVSKDWNRGTGRPLHGNTASFLKSVLSESHAYSELSETVGEFGYEVHVGEIEKIVVLPVQQFPAVDRQRIHGIVQPKDKLPYAWSEYFILIHRQ